MKTKLLFLISIFFYSIGFGQKQNITKKNSLEFSIGYKSGALKNLDYAPVSRYDYNGVNYILKYVRTSKNENLFEVQLNYLDSELKSNLIPALNSEYSKIVLDFSYLKRVYNKNKLTIHTGLQSQTNASSYNQWQAFDFQQKIGIAGRFSFQINQKQSLSSKLTIPFVMLRISSFDTNIYSLNDFQNILYNTEYKYTLSNHFDMKVNYNFNYARLQIPNSYKELQHQISLGINYKF